MTLAGALAISFGSAWIGAVAWVLLIDAVDQNREWFAGLCDLILVGMGYVPIQLWGDIGQDKLVFYARIVGSAMATVATIKFLRAYKRKRAKA